MAFQTFEPPAIDADDIADRVARVRREFAALGIDGIVVPHEDEYQSEYLPASEERLAYISGFTGSAGRAFILADAALLATDGRYTLQAGQQVPAAVFTVASDPAAADAWCREHLAGRRLGIDARLFSRASLKALAEKVDSVTLVRLDHNPVDAIWGNHRPAAPRGTVRLHPQRFAGEDLAAKLARVREKALAAGKADAVLVAESDSVSWLLNWRGADVAHTPLVLARAFVPMEGEAVVFVDPAKVPPEIAAALDGVARIAPADTFLAALADLAAGRRVAADPHRAPDAALAAIEERGTLVEASDPVVTLKAVKNAAEIAGMRAAHQRDGAAVTRFLAWFDDHAVGTTEIGLVARLEQFRRDAGATDVSFDTIAGSGPNGAIVHYHVDRSSDRTIEAGDPVLIDSGAQYQDGTTDITRTVCAGTPADGLRVQFTRVLRGHIAIARARFPEGALGSELDPLARAALWRAGHDYRHGTGHGVGAALGVHEGPQSISRRGREPLVAGMIVSNEPGDYHVGAFGIRIEALCLVREARVPPGGVVPMHWFETLTLAPIDTRLVLPTMMAADEIGWLDAYHARVRGALSGELSASERDWLARRTRPLG